VRSDEDRSGRHADLDRDNPDIGHAGAITEETRCHTLEFAAVGPAFGDRLRRGGTGVARARNPALARRDVQILDWSL